MNTTSVWLDNTANLVEFLSKRNFSVGTGEAIRLTALLDRLGQEGKVPDGPAEAAKWLAPILCSTPEEQNAFAELLIEYSTSPPVDRLRQPAPTSEPQPTVGKSWWILAIIVTAAATYIIIRELFRFHLASNSSPVGQSLKWDIRPASLITILNGIWYAAFPWLGFMMFRRFYRPRPPILRRRLSRSADSRRLYAPAAESKLFASSRLRGPLQTMRAHRFETSDDFDLRRSIKATVAAAGYPVIAYADKPRLPEYPILVEELSQKDHLAALGHALAARFREERLASALYTYSIDPRRLRGDSRRPLNLGELAARHGQGTILIVSDGSILIDPLSQSLRPWVPEFLSWRRRVLFTPIPVSRWASREQLLSGGGFTMLPATPHGLELLADMVARERDVASPTSRLSSAAPGPIAANGRQNLSWHHDIAPPVEERDALLEDLALELSKPALDLTAILAIFPEIRLDLTIRAGLFFKRRDLQTNLLDDEVFAAVAGLPWFRLGRMPDWLRLELIKWLSAKQLDSARDFYKKWLSEASADSAGPPIDITPRILEDEARKPGSPLRDVIFLRFQRGESLNDLDLEAPDKLANLLTPTWRDPMRLAILICAILTIPFAALGQLYSVPIGRSIHWLLASYGSVFLMWAIISDLAPLVIWHSRCLFRPPRGALKWALEPSLLPLPALIVALLLITSFTDFMVTFGLFSVWCLCCLDASLYSLKLLWTERISAGIASLLVLATVLASFEVVSPILTSSMSVVTTLAAVLVSVALAGYFRLTTALPFTLLFTYSSVGAVGGLVHIDIFTAMLIATSRGFAPFFSGSLFAMQFSAIAAAYGGCLAIWRKGRVPLASIFLPTLVSVGLAMSGQFLSTYFGWANLIAAIPILPCFLLWIHATLSIDNDARSSRMFLPVGIFAACNLIIAISMYLLKVTDLRLAIPFLELAEPGDALKFAWTNVTINVIVFVQLMSIPLAAALIYPGLQRNSVIEPTAPHTSRTVVRLYVALTIWYVWLMMTLHRPHAILTGFVIAASYAGAVVAAFWSKRLQWAKREGDNLPIRGYLVSAVAAFALFSLTSFGLCVLSTADLLRTWNLIVFRYWPWGLMSSIAAAVIAYRIDQKKRAGIRWQDTVFVALPCALGAILVTFLLQAGCSCLEPPYWRGMIVSGLTGGAIAFFIPTLHRSPITTVS